MRSSSPNAQRQRAWSAAAARNGERVAQTFACMSDVPAMHWYGAMHWNGERVAQMCACQMYVQCDWRFKVSIKWHNKCLNHIFLFQMTNEMEIKYTPFCTIQQHDGMPDDCNPPLRLFRDLFLGTGSVKEPSSNQVTSLWIDLMNRRKERQKAQRRAHGQRAQSFVCPMDKSRSKFDMRFGGFDIL